MKEEFIIKDIKKYLRNKKKELERLVNDLVKQDIRVVSSGGWFVDVIYLDNYQSVKNINVRNYAFKIADKIINLQRLEEQNSEVKKDDV